MPRFRCPSCNRCSNKFINKCPDCGYERGKGKEIKVDDEDIKTNRELQRKRSIARNKFRGGRNKNISGAGHQPYTRRGNR